MQVPEPSLEQLTKEWRGKKVLILPQHPHAGRIGVAQEVIEVQFNNEALGKAIVIEFEEGGNKFKGAVFSRAFLHVL
jgi:hypothetical protein